MRPNDGRTNAYWCAAIVAVLSLFAVSCTTPAEPDETADAIDAETQADTALESEQATNTPPPAPPTSVDEEQSLVTINLHCGVRYLSPVIEGKNWWNPEAPDGVDWVPDEWGHDPRTQVLLEVAVLVSGDGSELTATFAGHSVTYVPVPDGTLQLCA